PSIDTHDFETKLGNAVKFLKSGDKVKVSVRFRGREMQHTALGKTLLDRFQEGIQEVGSVERPPKMEGRNMVMFIAPAVQK
ncbi:MAG: translation initiation factor IF-3, partial [Clostridia bacterium]|nr:translation initiation factor IF-3 [Clostridia bacterium]